MNTKIDIDDVQSDLSALAEKFGEDDLVNMAVSLGAMLDSTLRLLENKAGQGAVFGKTKRDPLEILMQIVRVRMALNALCPMFAGQADLGMIHGILRDFLGEDEGEHGSSEEAQR